MAYTRINAKESDQISFDFHDDDIENELKVRGAIQLLERSHDHVRVAGYTLGVHTYINTADTLGIIHYCIKELKKTIRGV